MINKLENIFIFSFLMYSERDDYISEDYFNEKILKFVGIDKDVDGKLITVDKFRSYMGDGGEFLFFELLDIFDISKVNSDKLIHGDKINGIHPVMSKPLLKIMKILFDIHKSNIREIKLKYLLEN